MSDVRKAVVLLSGGLDSYTTAAIAREEGYEICTLTIKYGQTHANEIEASRRIRSSLNVSQYLELPVDLASIGGSSLTTNVLVPKDQDLDSSHIPTTYVPARNTVFLALALSWAEVLGARDLFIGVNALDYSGYPDCRPEFIKAFQALAGLATKVGVEGEVINVHAPLIKLNKAEIIRRGFEMNLDYGLTHSCYAPSDSGKRCGRCDSCRLRARGFKDAGKIDPIFC